MPQITLKFNDMEWKALEWDIYDIQKHFQGVVSHKAYVTMNVLIEKRTNLNPKKLDKEERENHIRGMNLETAKERTDRMEKE